MKHCDAKKIRFFPFDFSWTEEQYLYTVLIQKQVYLHGLNTRYVIIRVVNDAVKLLKKDFV